MACWASRDEGDGTLRLQGRSAQPQVALGAGAAVRWIDKETTDGVNRVNGRRLGATSSAASAESRRRQCIGPPTAIYVRA